MSTARVCSPVPRLAIAVAVGLTASLLEFLRRRRRGPIRTEPPVASKRPHKVVFGKVEGRDNGHADLLDPPISREDPFYWLRDDDRSDEKVLSHLHAENAYTNYKTHPLRKSANLIYNQLLSHYVENDTTVPTPRESYVYYEKTIKALSYKLYCRKPIKPDGTLGEEDVLLDVNVLARGQKYCDVFSCVVSPHDSVLAYSVDFAGYETYEIRFIHLETRTDMTTNTLRGTTGSIIWGPDSSVVFFITMDDAQRPHKLWQVGLQTTPASIDEATTVQKSATNLFTENDTEFRLYAFKSLSGRFVIAESAASSLSESHIIDFNRPRGSNGTYPVALVRERKANTLYFVDHAKDDILYIVTNEGGATNFKIMHANAATPSEWKDVLPYNADVKVDEVSSFESFAVMSGRQNGYQQLWVVPDHDFSQMYLMSTDDEAHSITLARNFEYAATSFHFTYSSLVMPKQTYIYHVTTKEKKLLKQEQVRNYDPSEYATDRLVATSADGVEIPVSLVYKKSLQPKAGPAMLNLLGYGSYEISSDPVFSLSRLGLLENGVTFAMAHVRGGGEYGRAWYEAARFETKKKTFEDFVAVAEMLVGTGRTNSRKMSIEGWSAGGLLVGAVLNMRPQLFRAALAGVPFVDVLNSMSDATLPLTTTELQEWGNPHTNQYHDAIQEYCPYSNVHQAEYPAVLALAGLYDPRVTYSEPAKWVAKLRENTTGDKAILLKTDMSSGHFSSSNRYSYLRQKSFEVAWLLDQLGDDTIVDHA